MDIFIAEMSASQDNNVIIRGASDPLTEVIKDAIAEVDEENFFETIDDCICTLNYSIDQLTRALNVAKRYSREE